MKKLFILLFILLILLIVTGVSFQYLHCRYKGINNFNDHLTPINYLVQILYNIGYFIIACVVLFIAYDQLNKTREATTIQTLTNIANNLKSDDYFKRRKALASFILNIGKDAEGRYLLKDMLEELRGVSNLDEEQTQKIAIIKNKFEAVIYDFEVLGYYHEKNIFSIEAIYELFSYEIQHYWILIGHLGYVNYLRTNKLNGEGNYYNKFHKIYRLGVKSEIRDRVKCINILCKKEKKQLFYKQAREILKKRNDSIDLFLYEEMNLI